MNEKDMKIIELSDDQVEGVTGGTLFAVRGNAGVANSSTVSTVEGTAAGGVPINSVALASPGGTLGTVNVLGGFGGDNSGSLIHFGSEPPAPPAPLELSDVLNQNSSDNNSISMPSPPMPPGAGQFSAPTEPSQVGAAEAIQAPNPEAPAPLSSASEQTDTPLRLY